jgi:hypothetical protein
VVLPDIQLQAVVLLDSGFAGQWFCWTVGRNREFFGKQLMPVVPG